MEYTRTTHSEGPSGSHMVLGVPASARRPALGAGAFATGCFTQVAPAWGEGKDAWDRPFPRPAVWAAGYKV